MSSKTKKTTTVTSSSSSSSFTSPVGGGTAGLSQRPRSPLSPTRYSRLQEKAELSNLNDRLACYMDKVRSLEQENNRLTREVRISQESVNREVTAFKSLYDQELSDARRLLDDIAKDKAQAEIDNKRLAEENDDLKSSLDKKTKECRNLEANLNICEHRATDLQTKYNQAISDKKKLEEELKDTLKELDKLKKSYELTKKYIENETLTRVELENKLQSMKEEANFKEQMFQKEITVLRTKRKEEISEIDGRLTVEYEDKLQALLHEMREQHEQQILVHREEITALYETKLKALQDRDQRNTAAIQASTDEIRTLQNKLHHMSGQLGPLESANAALENRVQELEKLLENERTTKIEHLAQLEEELARLERLRDQHEQQISVHRKEITLLEAKVKALQDRDQKNSSALQSSTEENRSLKAKLQTVSGQIHTLESTNAALENRIRDLEKLLEHERTTKIEQLAHLEQELSTLRQEMSDQLKDYHDLMDIKVALDTEISAYRKLLEVEENRLNITPANVTPAPTPATTRRGTPLRRTPVPKSAKRRRIFHEESQEVDSFQVTGECKGEIEISDVDPEGKFIQLHNKGDKEVSLSGWSIKHNAGADEKETTHKFHRSVKIEPKGNVTVWSADSGHTHSPPEHILMKQKWFMSDAVNTVVINKEGEEVATRQRQRVQYSALRREREASEESQDGDPKRDSCILM